MRRMPLPDINVWLALAFASHKHHPKELKAALRRLAPLREGP